MRTTLDFSPLFRTGIGFDRVFDALDTATRVQPVDNWPPYDIIKQGEDGATPVGEICRKAGISQATYFNWKKKYDGLLPTEMRRLKQLEDENGKLRKVVADLSLDKEMLQDALRRKL